MDGSEISSAELELLTGLSTLFGRLGLRWYVFGGQAAIAYGARRSTNDIDVTVVDGGDRVREIIAGLVDLGWTLVVDDEEFVRRTRVLPARSSETGLGLDIVFGADPYERQIADRAVVCADIGLPFPVASPEDVVVMKLLAGRPRDIDDVREIVAHRPDLDFAYVRPLLGLLEEGLARDDLVDAFEAAVAARL